MYSSMIIEREFGLARDRAQNAFACAQVGDEAVRARRRGQVVGVVAPGVALGARRRSNTPSTRPRSAARPSGSGRSPSCRPRPARPTARRRRTSSVHPGLERRHVLGSPTRCGRRRGTRESVSSTSAVLCAPRGRRRGASAPSGQYANSPPSQSWNHATPVAIGMRHSSNRPEWCMATSSHCGITLRLAPRNSGTSVCMASSWPGTIRLANTMAGSITGRPCTRARGVDERLVVQERLDAVDQRSSARRRIPRGSSSCAARAS